jgi:tetratricopeptide (TPR) repeat protein
MSESDFDVFLCHNSRDKLAVEKIARALQERGLRPWLDVWELRPGLPWQRTLEAQIERIGAAAVFVGTEGRGPWQELEIEAFLRQFVKRGCPVIPVVLRECREVPKLPVFVEGMTWVDFRVESPDPLERLVWGITGKKPDSGPAATASAAPTRISISRLPVTGEHFVGRDDELARLDDAWDDPSTHVISFVAFGGVGKSALVNRWLDRLAADGWRGAERVLGWSFYSQGTDATGASGDAFVEEALEWFGYQGEPLTSPPKKGEVLARHVRAARTLLVLDGLEPLQHPPGSQGGRLKDPTVGALVRELALQNPGLCVITTRVKVADVAGRSGVQSVDLEQLPPEAGAELLKKLGVQGPDKELREASEEFGGHGLALSLLGTYLRDVCDGDVRRRREVPLLDEDIEQGVHARSVMARYETWLGLSELQVLRLVGLFDRPAEAEALASLRAAPPIPGLTEEIGAGDEGRWRKALAKLRRARLLAVDDGFGVDAHPLVRAYFGERLLAERPEAWRAGHERLYEHYRQAAPDLPETLEEMLPLYTAVVHGCRAGRAQETAADVYSRRILRGAEHFSWKKLGAFGSELTALAGFFDRSWDRPSAQLTAADQAWILNEAGFVLRALGRLPEAVQPLRAGLEARIVEENWKNAAISAGNLSELTLTLGEVASAVQAGEESVELADRSGDAAERMSERTTLADALHQAGRWEESAASFREAEAMQAESLPQYPRLTSLPGYRYCDLLLSMAEPEDGSGVPVGQAAPADSDSIGRRSLPYKTACEDVRDRAHHAIEIAQSNNWILDIALDHLSLGRAHLGLALTSGASPDFTEAAVYLDRAVDGLRQSGNEDDLPRGLLARAALRRLRDSPDDAASDLGEAQEIAERGHMRLHEADVHLEWTRLSMQTGDLDDARRHLERARELVASTGYGRREREVAYLERRLGVGRPA